MLDKQDNGTTDPTDPTGDGTEPAATTPAVRRRRATKAVSSPAEAPDSAAISAGTASAGTAEGGTAAPAKRTRKAPAKKAVAAAAPEPADHLGETTGDGPGDTPSARTPRKRATKAAGPSVAPAASESRSAAGFTEEPAKAPARRARKAPALALTFQAPASTDPGLGAATAATETDAAPATETDAGGVAPAPRRRRRAGTSGSLSPQELLPTLLEPSTVAGDAELDEEEEFADGTTAEGDDDGDSRPRRRRRGRRGRGAAGRRDENGELQDETDSDRAEPAASTSGPATDDDDDGSGDSTRRRRRRRRTSGGGAADGDEDGVPTVTHVREAGRQQRVRGASEADEDGVRGITGSTRMAAKRARRQEGRDSGRRRPPVLTEAEFLARREAVERTMVVRQTGERTQIAVLEDGVLVEHYVTKASAQSYAGNVYLGRVQNVLPSMEAAFVDIGKSKNGVLYAGEVNYELAGSGPRKIEAALKSGQEVLVQVSKDPIGHKGARLTSAVSLPGRYLVYVPQGSMTGISRKLPENERARLKSILKKLVPDDAGVIIRTAAEGASEEEISADVHRLQHQWETIQEKAKKGGAPKQLHAEPDLVVRVVRDVFNEDFTSLVVQGDSEWEIIKEYVDGVAPDLAPRLSKHTAETDVFTQHRIDEQLAKALDRKVWLPSGGSLVIDRTEAMVVIDVNTGKYVGKGGNLEETVTRNNLEAAEEIARQLRLRDLGGIIVVDFIDMVLESNRDLVVRRLVECLGRDRTKHQVAEVTSLGLVQMTRKRVGQGLLESFSETCEHCHGRGVIVSSAPVDRKQESFEEEEPRAKRRRGGAVNRGAAEKTPVAVAKNDPVAASAVAAIARASALLPKDADADADADLPEISGTALDAGRDDDGIEDALAAAEVGASAPASEPSSARGRGRRRSGRATGAGVDAPGAASSPAVATPTDLPTAGLPTAGLPTTDPAEVAEQPEEADPIAAEQVEAEPIAAADHPADHPAEHPADDAAPAPRRRRRAVSRPAGPAQ